MEAVREALEWASKASIEESIEVLDSFKEYLLNVRSGHFRELNVNGGLVKIDGKKPIVVVGDIHGDLDSLKKILTSTHVLEALEEGYLVFLGDYVDRGFYSPEVYLTTSLLTLKFKGRIVVLRGNHEPPPGLTPYPHDLPYHLYRKYKSDSDRLYRKMYETFQLLLHSCIWGDKAFLVHGGVPTEVSSLSEVAEADTKHPNSKVLEELLWNDPIEGIEDWMPSHRGAGRLFGKRVTEYFLREVCRGVRVVIRGHEPCEGYKINHEGLVLTLFSRGGPPYYNSRASYLAVKSLEFKNVYDLVEDCIVTFEV